MEPIDVHIAHARRLLQAFEAKLNHFSATVAEGSAQRGTTPAQVAAMELLLVSFETVRNGMETALKTFAQGDAELALAQLAQLEPLRALLAQKLGSERSGDGGAAQA
jgi:hypothetical protein